jgi:cation transport ATPase
MNDKLPAVALPNSSTGGPLTIDPVCGMTVRNNTYATDYDANTYRFCSAVCLSRFSADPTAYLNPSVVPSKLRLGEIATATNNVVYTCPMHAEIRQIGPGACPKCGMALEPAEADAHADTTELDDMTGRFWASLALSVPLLFVTMSEFIPGVNLHDWMGLASFNWLQAALGTPVVLWGGWPFFVRAWTSFRTWNLNLFSLMGLGTAAAFLFSMIALLMPDALPATFKMNGMAPLYFEAAAVIITLVLMGQVLELRGYSGRT